MAAASLLAALPQPGLADSGPVIALNRLPARVEPGTAVRVAGTVAGPAGPLATQPLELEISRGASRRFSAVARTVSSAGGQFSFEPIRVDGDIRLRVVDAAAPGVSSAVVAVQAPAFPAAGAVRAAARYLAGRAGTKAFAEINDEGQLAGVAVHVRFHSASTVKSLLLVAYLQMLAAEHSTLSDAGRALLYPMIHSSSNEAATAVLEAVGEPALNRVAREAHMTDYVPGGATWGFTEISASDLARFFYEQERLTPPRFRGYARWLLSTIEPSESWGIPAAVRPRFEVFFKGGWLPEVEGLVNQAARLERKRTVFALAVLTRHDPSMAYGEQTIAGVASALLGEK